MIKELSTRQEFADAIKGQKELKLVSQQEVADAMKVGVVFCQVQKFGDAPFRRARRAPLWPAVRGQDPRGLVSSR
jgi:hypothetical protein